MKRINYKSDFDFYLNLTDSLGNVIEFPSFDWKLVMYAKGRQSVTYEAGCVGGECYNCLNDGGRMHIVADSHGLGTGVLYGEFYADVPNVIYNDGKELTVTPFPLGIILVSTAGDKSVEADVTNTIPVVFINAYELAVSYGYQGTEAEYMAALVRIPTITNEVDSKIAEVNTAVSNANKAIGEVKTNAESEIGEAQTAAEKAISEAKSAAETAIGDVKASAQSAMSQTQSAAESAIGEVKANAVGAIEQTQIIAQTYIQSAEESAGDAIAAVQATAQQAITNSSIAADEAESLRVAAENIRNSQEQTRQFNESERQSAEDARVLAESERVSEFSELKGEVDSIATDAKAYAQVAAQSATNASISLQNIYDKIDEVGDTDVAIAAIQEKLDVVSSQIYWPPITSAQYDALQNAGDLEDKLYFIKETSNDTL